MTTTLNTTQCPRMAAAGNFRVTMCLTAMTVDFRCCAGEPCRCATTKSVRWPGAASRSFVKRSWWMLLTRSTKMTSSAACLHCESAPRTPFPSLAEDFIFARCRTPLLSTRANSLLTSCGRTLPTYK